jgi:hypothetical protein
MPSNDEVNDVPNEAPADADAAGTPAATPVDNTQPNPAENAPDNVVATHEDALAIGFFGESPSYDEMQAQVKTNAKNDAKRAKAAEDKATA